MHMIKLLEAIKVDVPLKHTVGWSLVEVLVTESSAMKYSGRLTILKRPEGTRENHQWTATYVGSKQWKISGPGARMGSNARVPNVDEYPFSLDAGINSGIRTAMSDWLNQSLGDKPLNGERAPAPAATAPHSATAPVLPAKAAIVVSATVTKPAASESGPGKLVISVAPIVSPPSVNPPVPPRAQAERLWVRTDAIIAFQPQANDPRFSGQPRKWFDEGKLRKLGKSMKQFEQQDAITVILYKGDLPGIQYELVNGERRLRAAILAGIEFVMVTIGQQVDKKTQHLRSLIQNFCKAEHTPRELSDSLQEQVEAGMSQAELAEAIARTPVFISTLLSLQRLHPSLKELLDPPIPKKDRLRIYEGKILSRIPVDKQVEIWNQVKQEQSRRVLVSKLEMLCKPHIVHLRIGRAQKPSTVARSVERRVDAACATITDLSLVEPGAWSTLLQTKTAADQAKLVASLSELEASIQALKARVIRARVGLPKAPAASGSETTTSVRVTSGSLTATSSLAPAGAKS